MAEEETESYRLELLLRALQHEHEILSESFWARTRILADRDAEIARLAGQIRELTSRLDELETTPLSRLFRRRLAKGLRELIQ